MQWHNNQQLRRFARYGSVRPIIQADFAGQKWIAIGSVLHHSDQWETFHDFLIYFVRRTFGFTWGKKESAKPIGQRHPVVELSAAVAKFLTKYQPDKDETVVRAPANGIIKTYLSLAYDLYIVSDTLLNRESRHLLKKLLKRLRSRGEYQGARYELAVIATMVRANFEILDLGQRDPSKKRPEFLAQHRISREIVAVEAKSKHRAGVLGYPGEVQQPEELKLGIRGLFKDAIQQSAGHPLIVFLDLNLPPKTIYDRDFSAWSKEVRHVLEKEDRTYNRVGIKCSGFNLLLLTNFPHHYGRDEEKAPDIRVSVVQPANPRMKLRAPEVLESIVQAAQQYGNVPVDFVE
jgi:hypothetical protein